MDFEISQEGDTVDKIAWRRRKATRKVTEAIFLLNPGLADHGPVLPPGLKVKLPDPPKAVSVVATPRIWS
jgi:phage tail protein X